MAGEESLSSAKGSLYADGATGLSLETEAGKEAVLRKVSAQETVQDEKMLLSVVVGSRDRGYVEIAAYQTRKIKNLDQNVSIVFVVGQTGRQNGIFGKPYEIF